VFQVGVRGHSVHHLLAGDDASDSWADQTGGRERLLFCDNSAYVLYCRRLRRISVYSSEGLILYLKWCELGFCRFWYPIFLLCLRVNRFSYYYKIVWRSMFGICFIFMPLRNVLYIYLNVELFSKGSLQNINIEYYFLFLFT